MSIYKYDPNTLKSPLTFIYNGADARWKQEAAFIKEKDSAHKLTFVDGSAAGASVGPGVDTKMLAHEPYVRDAAGTVVHGLDAVYAAHNDIGFGPWFLFNRVPGFKSEGTGIVPQK